MNKQQITIFLLVGVMLFSVIGTGLIFLADGSGDEDIPSNAGENNTTVEVVDGQNEGEEAVAAEDVDELSIKDLEVGDGQEVKAGDEITVHYEGRLLDGTVFDSSYERGQPATFELTGLIEGWQEGIPGMKVGGKRELTIPSSKGYGEAGSGVIPPNAGLIFEIELIEIVSSN